MTHLKIKINLSLSNTLKILAARFLSCLLCLSAFILTFIIIVTTLPFHLTVICSSDTFLFHTFTAPAHTATSWTFMNPFFEISNLYILCFNTTCSIFCCFPEFFLLHFFDVIEVSGPLSL